MECKELLIRLHVNHGKIASILAKIEEHRRGLEECCRELNTYYISSASPAEENAEDGG